jgi:hypothetical protein
MFTRPCLIICFGGATHVMAVNAELDVLHVERYLLALSTRALCSFVWWDGESRHELVDVEEAVFVVENIIRELHASQTLQVSATSVVVEVATGASRWSQGTVL